MSLTIRDAENSWLESKRTWEKFLTEAQVQWLAPELLSSIAGALRNTPPEIMQRLPGDTRRRLEALIQGKGG